MIVVNVDSRKINIIFLDFVNKEKKKEKNLMKKRQGKLNKMFPTRDSGHQL